MSTPILICAGISVLLLIFALAQIVAALGNIRETLDIIHRDLCVNHDVLVWLFGKQKPGKQKPAKQKPAKHREYWRDQNGFKHWRKKDA